MNHHALADAAGSDPTQPETTRLASAQSEDRSIFIREEFLDLSDSTPEEPLDRFGRTIANSDPDNLRRVSLKKAPLTEICVLGDDSKTMLDCVVPNHGVGGIPHGDFAHMYSAWKNVRQCPTEQV
jgi:hypothetical protein